MLRFKYSNCPCCGQIHDAFEGGGVKIGDTGYWVCLDCLDSYSKDEIIEKIKHNEGVDK